MLDQNTPLTQARNPAPPGGGGVLPYMGYIGMYRCEGYGLLWDRVYKSESLGLE